MRLKEIRVKNKKTQQEVANNLNMQQTTYGKYELEKAEPNIQTLIKLADYYDVSIDYLCEHKIKNEIELGYLTSEQKSAIKVLITLSEYQLARTTSFMLGIKAQEN